MSLLCGLWLLMPFTNAWAQRSPERLGRIEKSGLETDYSKDFPDANAIVLFDFGNVFFEYNSQKGFQVIFEKHIRLKILNKDGLDWANGSVSLYRQRGDREVISKLNGFTHNLENAKVESTKLTSNGIYQEEVSENWQEVKFTMPNVREGSVIEYSYTVTSDFNFTLPDWYFQKEIPVLYSELNVKIPEYFKYKTLMKGYEPLSSHEEKMSVQKFNIFVPGQTVSQGMQGSQRVPAQNYSIDAQATTRKWISTNVPAFVEEPYLTSSNDYMTGLEFELSAVDFPGQFFKSVTNTWEDIRKTLIESEKFGRQIRRGNYLGTLVQEIIGNTSDPRRQMILAYEMIQNRMKWNGRNSIYVTKTIREALNEGVGSSGDINLMLVVLLRELGLEANPVIISTRRNGKLHPARVMLSKFNYVIAHVRLENEDYLFDATDPHCPYFLLPERCLNEQGRIISEEYTNWIPLKAPSNSYRMLMAEYVLSEDDQLVGKVQQLSRNYAAYQLKSRLFNDDDYKKYQASLENGFVGMNIQAYQVENLDDLSAGIKEVFDLQLSNVFSRAGNLIYFNPMLHERLEKNPFSLEERKYPVDYGYPMDRSYMLNFEIPEGYELDDAPENIRLALPENAGIFTYQVTVLGNKLQVMSRIQINQTLFVFSDYKLLKEFYNIVVNKHSEQIVLKKI